MEFKEEVKFISLGALLDGGDLMPEIVEEGEDAFEGLKNFCKDIGGSGGRMPHPSREGFHCDIRNPSVIQVCVEDGFLHLRRGFGGVLISKRYRLPGRVDISVEGDILADYKGKGGSFCFTGRFREFTAWKERYGLSIIFKR